MPDCGNLYVNDTELIAYILSVYQHFHYLYLDEVHMAYFDKPQHNVLYKISL